jgi:hypothetical protein
MPSKLDREYCHVPQTEPEPMSPEAQAAFDEIMANRRHPTTYRRLGVDEL